MLSRRTGCTVPITLLTAVNVMLCGYSGQQDILVAWASAARNRPELGALIGPFLNTVVIRTNLSGNPTFQDLMVRVRKATLSAYDHQEIPFITLLREFFPGQPLSRTLLTPVLFNMLQFSSPAGAGAAEAPPPDAPQPELTMDQVPLEIEEQAKFDLTFSCTETPTEIYLHITGAADIFDPQTVAMIESDCGKLLSRAVQEPQTHVDELTGEVSRRC